jgi:DNA (cytosine-5)-methyltransferase 1
VLSDLAALGYGCRWTVLGAADVGAPHQRDRFWLVANADSTGLEERKSESSNARTELASIERADWWESEPDVGRVANGVADRVDRLKAVGNGQVPKVAETAWRMLTAKNSNGGW